MEKQCSLTYRPKHTWERTHTHTHTHTHSFVLAEDNIIQSKIEVQRSIFGLLSILCRILPFAKQRFGKHFPKRYKNRRPLLDNSFGYMELEAFPTQCIHKQQSRTLEGGDFYTVRGKL
jgi:hypothetical protein